MVGDAVGVAVPLTRRDRHRRHHGKTGRGEHDLHVRLVHADGTGQHARADVADPGHLEHPLDGAVLAPRARAARGRPRRPHRASAAAATARARPGRWTGVARQGHGGPPPSTSGELVGTGDLQRLGVARLQHPAAVGGDADRHHVVRRPVDGLQHAPRGHARDGVLAGPAAEHHGHALLGLGWLIGPVNLAT